MKSGDCARLFWSVGTGWGRFVLREGEARLEVLGGTLALERIGLPLGVEVPVSILTPDGASLRATAGSGGVITLTHSVALTAGQALVLRAEGLSVNNLPDAAGL